MKENAQFNAPPTGGSDLATALDKEISKKPKSKKKAIIIIGLIVIIACLSGLLFFYFQGNGGLVFDAAAKVNGTAISEQKVTDRILATKQRYESDRDWAGALKSAGYTAETLRESVINSYIDEELIAQWAKKNGVSYDKESVDNEITKAKATSDKNFDTYLKENGFFNEGDFKVYLINKSINEKVTEKLAADTKLNTDETNQALTSMKANYTGRRASIILLSGKDIKGDKGKEARDKKLKDIEKALAAKDADFAKIASKFSDDKKSAKNGGDVGFTTVLGSGMTDTTTGDPIPAELIQRLSSMNVGEVSEPINVGEDIFIVKCTGDYNGAGDDKDIPKQIREAILKAYKLSMSTNELAKLKQDLRKDATIKIEKMPKDLAYDIDIDKALKQE